MSRLFLGDGPLVWTGKYPPTDARLRLTLELVTAGRIMGTIEYVDDGTITNIQGKMAETPHQLSGDDLWPDRSEWPESSERVALQFKEVSIRTAGRRRPDLNGEYRVIASSSNLAGAWISAGRMVGHFTMRRS